MGNKKNNYYNKKNNYSNNKNRNNNYNKKYENKESIDENLIKDEINEEEKVIEKQDGKKEEVKIEDEIDNSFKEEIKSKNVQNNKHPFIHFFLIILLLISLGFFVINILDKDTSVNTLICNLLLTIFTIFFVTIGISYNRKRKGMVFISSLLLVSYFLIGINNSFKIVDSPIATVEDFNGKSLTYVIKWADKNNILVNQEYEYSDMVKEYDIISQNIKSGTSLKETKEITVSVSEGPNPSKEIMVPSMISWDTERVINFINDNYLNNVVVEFVSSDKEKDTVIEQNITGNMKRDEEFKLTFSYGEELDDEEVKLIDFTNKSKFEVEFYMKQHQLRYDFEDDFSNKIKKGFTVKQNIKAGEVVHIDDERVIVTISKGPEIKVPDLKNYSVTKITEWAIKNKLKLNFSDKYDDSIKENNVISVNYEKNDIIEQGTVVKVVLSRGSLKMKKFKSLSDFYDWANKYEINYEEEHEFSDSVKAGEVISYSYKAGEAIKNNDTIIVKISDGSKKTVPNLKGLTKSEAINKLEKVGLKYSFVYRNSDDVSKGKVISQSISSGSEISSGTTITVTISNGKETNGSSNNNSNSNKKNNNNDNSNDENNNNSNNSNNNSDNKQKEDTPVVKDCSCNIRESQIQIELSKYSDCSSAASGLKSFVQGKCPNVSISVSCVADDTFGGGAWLSGYKGGQTDSCSLSTTLAK